jgi:hypothetical protein
MLTAIEYRTQAVRLLAMAICAHTTARDQRLRTMSEHAQHEAGIVLAEDDPEVVALVDTYHEEDRRDDDDGEASWAWERCPARE